MGVGTRVVDVWIGTVFLVGVTGDASRGVISRLGDCRGVGGFEDVVGGVGVSDEPPAVPPKR